MRLLLTKFYVITHLKSGSIKSHPNLSLYGWAHLVEQFENYDANSKRKQNI